MKKLAFPFIASILFLTNCNPDEIADESIVFDIDGNEYSTVVIGSQTWMTENLKTTRFNDGSVIDNILDSAEWFSQDVPAYCWYDNDPKYKDTNKGALYNFYAAANGNLCPEGWHIPTDDEWKELEDYIGMDPLEIDKWLYRGVNEAKKLKAVGAWTSEYPATDEYGFKAVPTGDRANWYTSPEFGALEISTRFWSSTLEPFPIIRGLYDDQILRYTKVEYFNAGYCVRCVKD